MSINNVLFFRSYKSSFCYMPFLTTLMTHWDLSKNQTKVTKSAPISTRKKLNNTLKLLLYRVNKRIKCIIYVHHQHCEKHRTKCCRLHQLWRKHTSHSDEQSPEINEHHLHKQKQCWQSVLWKHKQPRWLTQYTPFWSPLNPDIAPLDF